MDQLIRATRYYMNAVEEAITKLTGYWMAGSEQKTTSPLAFMEALEILGEMQTSMKSLHTDLQELVIAPTPAKAINLFASLEEAREESNTRIARLQELGPPI
ncbi:hypothetical protein IIB49_01785 [Patescibacteria group bacterium]|nr:hypothetical protein [Patescibacteria group bacterium]